MRVARNRLRRLFSRPRLVSGLALGAILTGSLFTLTDRHAGGQQAPPIPPFPSPTLTIHGANDGEPLNNSQNILVSASDTSRNYTFLVVFHGSRMISCTPVQPQASGGTQYVATPIDFTSFQNGPVNLNLLLLNDRMDRYLASTTWSGEILNPTLESVGTRMGQRILFRMRGRPGDQEYRLLAGDEPSLLRRSPFEGGAGGNAETVVLGDFPNPDVLSPPVPPEGASGDGSVDIVLNIDTLIRAHTLDGFLVLWTRSANAKTAYSKPLPLASLPPPSSPTTYTPAADSAASPYNR